MLSILFWTLSIFFLIRQIVIAAYRKKCGIVTIVLCLFFASLSALLTPHALSAFSMQTFAWTAALLSSFLCYDLHLIKQGKFRFSKLRAVFGLGFSALALLLIFSLSLPHLFQSETLLHIQLTGEKRQQIITWKNPSGPLMTQKVTAHRILIQDTQQSVIFDDYLYGDLATIRLKLINFPLWMQWIGFPVVWQPDIISTDYLLLERKKLGPSDTFSFIPQPKNAWQKMVWGFWDKIFFYEDHFFFIHSCCLNSTHLPLLDKKGSAIKGSFTVKLAAESKVPFISQGT